MSKRIAALLCWMRDVGRRASAWRLRWTLSFVACWLIAAFLPIIDPFGLGEISQKYSRDLYNLVIGSRFPSSFALPAVSEHRSERLNEDDVTVVLVDEQSLRRLSLDQERVWPATASFYAMALEAILAYEPNAVLVDVLFLDELPGSFEPLERTVRRYKEKHVPLLLIGEAAQNDVEPVSSVVLPADVRMKLTDRPKASPVTERLWNLALDLDMVEIVAAPLLVDDGVIRTYPLTGELSRIGSRKSAAVRAYEVETGKIVDSSDDSIELFWDLRVPEVNRQWMKCSSVSAARTGLIWRFATALLDPDELRQSCATTQTVPLIEILMFGRDPDAERLIKDKLIVFGADVIGGDYYPTAVSARIPGVFVHAMALENLLAFGERYPRTTLSFGAVRLETNHLSWLLEAPLVALVVSSYGMVVQRAGRDGRRLYRLLKAVLDAIGLGVITLILALFASALLMAQLSLAPLNWLGLGGLAILTYEIFFWIFDPMRNEESRQKEN